MKKASYWSEDNEGHITCELCPHGCRIAEGCAGRCRVRGVVSGELRALGYGLVSSAAVDPMEKKPLYHFLPGQSVFSIGGWGCNFGCLFCQNWGISQKFSTSTRTCNPGDVIEMATQHGTRAIAYTYNEPLVGFEFVRDCAVLAGKAGLKNVLVTNGFVRREPAAELLPYIDALNIDIKSMDESFYSEQCRGSLKPVLDFTVQAVAAGCHVEVTNLVITGLNDEERNFDQLSDWMLRNMGKNSILHLSAYHPDFKLSLPATSSKKMLSAFEICRSRLEYVYIGNMGGEAGHDTACPQCHALLVQRRGYDVEIKGIQNGLCAKCGRSVDFVMS